MYVMRSSEHLNYYPDIFFLAAFGKFCHSISLESALHNAGMEGVQVKCAFAALFYWT
jgi:hypothetical protein